MRGAWLTTLIALSAAMLLTAVRAHAADSVSTGTQAKNLLRVVTHDRNFGKRFDNDITVAVLFLTGHDESESSAEKMRTAIERLSGSAIKGHTIRAVKLGYESEDALAGAIHGDHINILYVCPELSDALDAISGVVRKRDVISVGATRDLVARGLSFGIVSVNGKTKILINVSASRKEGTKFSAQLLKVAETVD